jgi:5-methylthioadenosine/S-adenosylhomocysteine deaminase
VIIRGASLLDFRSLTRRDGVDVLIEGGRVARVAPGPLPAGGHAAIDAAGMYLLPGLVNTHCHTAMSLLRGTAEDCSVEDWFNRHVWLYERNLAPEDVYWGTLLGAAEMLLAGVTCVADHYFHMDRAFQACVESGIRADLAWAVFGAGEGWERQYEQAMDFTAAFTGRNPRLDVSLGPHSPYICPEPFLQRVAADSERLGLKMHIHVSEEARQVERSVAEKGCTPIETLDRTGVLRAGTVLAHAYHATDRDLELVARRGAGIAHCARTYLRFGDVHDFLPRALAAGVAVGLGTDGPASNSTLDIWETARSAALLAKASRASPLAAPIAEVLPLCHRGGQVLGLGGYGAVEEGALADLVLIDPRTPSLQPEHNVFANLLYSLGQRSVHTVIVDGKVVVRNGELLTVDTEELYRRTQEITGRLVRGAGGTPMQRY